MFRTIGRVLLGFLLACLAAGLAITSFAELNANDKYTSPMELILLTATHSAIFAAPFALVSTVIGEWQNIRSWLYYVLSGLAISLAGFMAQWSSEATGVPTIFNVYASAAFILSGLVAGFVYWLVAGQHAGNEVPLPDLDLPLEDRRIRVDDGPDTMKSRFKDMLESADQTSVPSAGGAGKKAAHRSP